jgi:hypothetical protein
MFIAILYFAAAGAAAAGGAGAAGVLYDRGRQHAATASREQDLRNLARLMQGEVDLADLRQKAVMAGVDPHQVEAGYFALRDGTISLNDALTMLRGTR